ncbi:hypothetical protein QBC38DRAFT_461851 [Podospora fimiseda]|uniref:F-box domain-containing protein n=1 Tax=Podospora fimiseda TaxID=252190 RepID=A0AAN6YQS7_9PEZI|nr:hypothetical protein QBC38DRAFT_461851 [Podospora fimiseda]
MAEDKKPVKTPVYKFINRTISILDRHTHLKPVKQTNQMTAPISSLLNLPNEIILDVVEFLQPLEAVALLLTCKRLYHLATANNSSNWIKHFQDFRGTRKVEYSSTLGEAGKSRNAGILYPIPRPRGLELEQDLPVCFPLLALLERDLKHTHQYCSYCQVLHRLPVPGVAIADFKYNHQLCHYCQAYHLRLVPGFDAIHALQPITSCVWAEGIGPNFWDLARITYHHVHEAMETYRSARKFGKPLPARAIMRPFIPEPCREYLSPWFYEKCTTLPSLTFTTPWSPHNLSSTNPSGYQGVKVKISIEAAVMTPRLYYHRSLFVHTTQRVFIPYSLLAETKSLPNNNWTQRKWLGFQICRHQPSYYPESTRMRSYKRPKYIVEDMLGIYYCDKTNKWSRPPKFGSGATLSTVKSAIRAKLTRLGMLNHDSEIETAESCAFRRTCDFCETKWRCTRFDHGPDKGVEAVVDVWQNWGPCFNDTKPGRGVKENWSPLWYNPMGVDESYDPNATGWDPQPTWNLDFR